jgi:hypothetical protein
MAVESELTCKQNWGARSFADNVGSWYWGHGRLGPYSIVWYDALTPAGAEYLSAYVTVGGKIIGSQCSGITVRPSGANSTYPPTLTSGDAEGFHIAIDLGTAGTLTVDVSRQVTLVNTTAYKRWTGSLRGGIEGSETWWGAALYEQFAFNA